MAKDIPVDGEPIEPAPIEVKVDMLAIADSEEFAVTSKSDLLAIPNVTFKVAEVRVMEDGRKSVSLIVTVDGDDEVHIVRAHPAIVQK